MTAGASAIGYLRRLYAHMAWADERVLDGLGADAGSDGEALRYYAHVLGAEHVWLTRIEGRASEVAVWPALTLAECAELTRRNRDGFGAVIEALSDGDLGRPISYVNSAGASFVTPFDEILIHVALHGAFHRGQVSLLVRRGGGTPRPTDYIAFVRGVPAATQADARARADAR